MKIYKVIAFSLLALLGSMNINAQLVVKEVKELPVDLYARYNARQNAQGEDLAVIKLILPTVQGISFNNNYGDVTEEKGEYIVYINPGTEYLDILENGEPQAKIIFSDWNVEIKPKVTYQALLSLEQQRAVGFLIEPSNAVLTINGENVPLNTEGGVLFPYEPGEVYEYSVTAEGYLPEENSFFFGEDETDIEPFSITLEPKTSKVTINSNAKKIDVFNGDIFVATINSGQSVDLPVGKQNLRLVADGYSDWKNVYNVPDFDTSVDITMYKQKDATSSHLRSRWGVYAGGGVALGQKVDDKRTTGYPIKIGVEYNYFITRNFTFRTELEALYYAGKDLQSENDKGEKGSPLAFDLAFPFSLNLPLSHYNLHFFTLGVGPLIGFAAIDVPTQEKSQTAVMYGGRLEAKFYLNRFTIGVSMDYQGFGKTKDGFRLSEKGLWVPTATIGYLFK